MQAILEWCGWTSYQATCLTPVLWALVALIVINVAVSLYCDADRRKAQRNRKRYHVNRK